MGILAFGTQVGWTIWGKNEDPIRPLHEVLLVADGGKSVLCTSPPRCKHVNRLTGIRISKTIERIVECNPIEAPEAEETVNQMMLDSEIVRLHTSRKANSMSESQKMLRILALRCAYLNNYLILIALCAIILPAVDDMLSNKTYQG